MIMKKETIPRANLYKPLTPKWMDEHEKRDAARDKASIDRDTQLGTRIEDIYKELPEHINTAVSSSMDAKLNGKLIGIKTKVDLLLYFGSAVIIASFAYDAWIGTQVVKQGNQISSVVTSIRDIQNLK